MLSSGMFSDLAASIAVRSRALPSGSPPPCLAAMVISRISRVNSAPRRASATAFFRLICFHLLWPAIRTPRVPNLQLDPSAAPQVGYRPMTIRLVVLVTLATVAACERPGSDRTEREVVGEALKGLVTYPRSSLVSVSAGRDAAQLVLSAPAPARSEEHTSELQSPCNLVCRLLLEKKNKRYNIYTVHSHL